MLGNIPDKLPRFTTKKWIEVSDKSGGACNTKKQIRFKPPMLRSDFCDCNDTYIIVTVKIIVTNPDNDTYDKKLAFKNNAPFVLAFKKLIIHLLITQKV